MRVYLLRAFLCEKQKTQTCFKDILKRLYLELLLYLFFFVFRPIRFVLQIYTIFAKQKTRCKILYRPTLTTPNIVCALFKRNLNMMC